LVPAEDRVWTPPPVCQIWSHVASELYDLSRDADELINRVDDPACAGVKIWLSGVLDDWEKRSR